MGLETVANLDDLVATNPTGGDPRSQLDDHIRNLKTALLADLVNNATKSSSEINLPFPSGVVVKIGTTAVAGTENTDATTTFTTAFPTACVGVLVTDFAAASSKSVVWAVSSKSTSNFTAFWTRSGTAPSATNRSGFYIAFGY